MSRKTIVVCDLCGANLPDDKHYGRFYLWPNNKPHVEASDLCPACAEYLAGAVQARKESFVEALRELAAEPVCALCGEVEDHRNHMDGTDGPDDGHEFRTSLAGDANDESEMPPVPVCSRCGKRHLSLLCP